MQANTFTKTTKQSYLSRLGDSIKGIFIGILLIIVAGVLLFWNEGRAVKRSKTLKQGSSEVVTVDSEKIDKSYEGKLVHLKGLATTREILTDQEFRVASSALKLKRIVEMYQWLEESDSETETKLGGSTETTTSYTYKTAWSENLNSSNEFEIPQGHENPPTMVYESEEFVADLITVGAFSLSPSLVGKINQYETLTIDEATSTAKMKKIDKPISYYQNLLYIGDDPSYPQVGDLRISYEHIEPLDVSIVAKQNGSDLTELVTKTGKLALLNIGDFSSEEMFEKAKQTNQIMTWVLRLLGVVLMTAGFSAILAPFAVASDIIPVFGKVTRFTSKLISGAISIPLSLIIIALAWFAYRPFLSLGIIAVGIAGFFGIKSIADKKSKTVPAVKQKPTQTVVQQTQTPVVPPNKTA